MVARRVGYLACKSEGHHVNLHKSPLVAATVAVAFLAVACVTAPLRADGLIYQLPEDGTSARFSLAIKAISPTGVEEKRSGSLTLSSVGSAQVDGQACRWIEVRMEMKAAKETDEAEPITVKVLVPEKNLTRGQDGWANMKKAWLKIGTDSNPRPIKDSKSQDSGLMTCFLSGPLGDAKHLPPVDVNSGIGNLRCEGVRGSARMNVANVSIVMENRLHEIAPFGVITSTIRIDAKREGRVDASTISLTLVEVGKDAKSEMPDAE